jgi:hypothetical protein
VLNGRNVILHDVDLNSKHEIPAFAEAASRRQAKFETISNNQMSNVQNKSRVWEI